MEFQVLKKINTFLITAVIVMLFGITYYMDTHDGKNPWSEGEIFNQTNYPRYTKETMPNHYSRYSNPERRKYNSVASNTREYRTPIHQGVNTNIPPQAIYVRELHRDVAEHWLDFKRATKDLAIDSVNIRIVIGRDGQILSSYIHKPSASKKYDKEALRFVRAHAPFKELPQGYDKPELNVSFTFGKNSFGTSIF